MTSSEVAALIKAAVERQDVSLIVAGLPTYTVPEEIRSLTNLRSLTLNGAKLRELPSGSATSPTWRSST